MKKILFRRIDEFKEFIHVHFVTHSKVNGHSYLLISDKNQSKKSHKFNFFYKTKQKFFYARSQKIQNNKNKTKMNHNFFNTRSYNF